MKTVLGLCATLMLAASMTGCCCCGHGGGYGGGFGYGDPCCGGYSACQPVCDPCAGGGFYGGPGYYGGGYGDCCDNHCGHGCHDCCLLAPLHCVCSALHCIFGQCCLFHPPVPCCPPSPCGCGPGYGYGGPIGGSCGACGGGSGFSGAMPYDPYMMPGQAVPSTSPMSVPMTP